jgi:hypothetical protein
VPENHGGSITTVIHGDGASVRVGDVAEEARLDADGRRAMAHRLAKDESFRKHPRRLTGFRFVLDDVTHGR